MSFFLLSTIFNKTAEIVALINEANYESVRAVENASAEIVRAIEAVTAALERGGRLVYMGAGTSGRLATAEAGVADLKAKCLTSADVVMGISASGSAEYVARGLEYAKSIGCTTVALASNADSRIKPFADIYIYTNTGAEVITGSTRMKAGNAQKMVLNMISTAAMIKTGKVYENMMINLKPANSKLRRRMIGIVCEITGLGFEDAEKLLEENDFSIPKAVNNKRA